MSTAFEQDRGKPDRSAGRLLRFTLRTAAMVVGLTVIAAWFLVDHAPGPAVPTKNAAANTGGSTLFYRASHKMSYSRSGDGRFHIDAQMNERRIPFVVDLNAAALMLSPDDARAAGIDASKLNFSEQALTPSGQMRAAPVVIPMMTLNQLTLFNVEGVVTEGSLPVSVIGRGFLKRFDSYDMGDDELTLRW